MCEFHRDVISRCLELSGGKDLHRKLRNSIFSHSSSSRFISQQSSCLLNRRNVWASSDNTVCSQSGLDKIEDENSGMRKLFCEIRSLSTIPSQYQLHSTRDLWHITSSRSQPTCIFMLSVASHVEENSHLDALSSETMIPAEPVMNTSTMSRRDLLLTTLTDGFQRTTDQISALVS